MRLDLMTSDEVAEYLKTSTGVIMPIGSQEQHGPMGLIGTDAQTAQFIGRHAGDAADILVGPTINVGMAQHHLGFPGSMSLRPTTLIAVIRDYVQSLARNGFTHFYFVNGHGGNITTVQTAFQEIYADASFDGANNGTAIRCRLANWFAMKPVTDLQKELYGDDEGFHATPSEVAVTQYVYPQAVKSMKESPAAPFERWFADASDYRALFPDGRMAAASWLATPEHGKLFVETASAAVVEDYHKFLKAEV
ncbi:creatininase family protein [Aestuariispira ectoiniformans]|uniref:creatininase family protein n=1 Tax=Aestuariispira ectoiniformans TaxID=2775080 RepID=UPI00223AA86B|nr:creatininase family protein [Aestuariispira ectoiniformans]